MEKPLAYVEWALKAFLHAQTDRNAFGEVLLTKEGPAREDITPDKNFEAPDLSALPFGQVACEFLVDEVLQNERYAGLVTPASLVELFPFDNLPETAQKIKPGLVKNLPSQNPDQSQPLEKQAFLKIIMSWDSWVPLLTCLGALVGTGMGRLN